MSISMSQQPLDLLPCSLVVVRLRLSLMLGLHLPINDFDIVFMVWLLLDSSQNDHKSQCDQKWQN